MTLRHLALLSLAPLLGLSTAACGGDPDPAGDGDSCRTGKCDDLDKPDSEVPDSPCDGVLVDESGRGNQKVAGRLNDPVADMVFKAGDDCPTSFQDILAKLRQNDTENCDPETEGAGMVTRAVSETAQPTGEPTDYRLVTTRACGGRAKHGIIFSLFGVQAGATAMPANVEIIAFDETEGVFNYYEADGRGEIAFFGNSKDMLKGAQGNVRRCAQCHDAGGLVMKELDTPWLHWEGHMDTPGAKELIEANPVLGSKNSGSEFESLVKGANRIWNETRLAFLRESGSVKDVLRPLFCSVEVNLDNGADFASPVEGGEGGSQISRIPFDSLLDPQLKGFGGISIEFADYDAQIKANGQNVPGVEGAVDTVFDYVFIERSHVDDDYVGKLKNAGIVDDELIKDVLLVDFTRHVFSEDRCGLLEFAPVLASDDLSPEAIRDGFLANLGTPAAGTPAAELRNNLLAEGGHSEKVDAFTSACEALEGATFVTNALTVTSLNRTIARGLHVFEFPATMPDDDLDVAPGTRLHPQTCELTTEFVAIAEEAAGPGPGPDPEPEPEPTACAHDVCEQGEALDPTCDADCVTAVCAADPFCCNSSWDSVCVGQVAEACSQSC